MNQEIYINVGKWKKVSEAEVYLRDVISVWCRDEKIKNRVNALKIYDFTGKCETRVIFTALKIVSEIEKNIQGVKVTVSGQTDILIEYDTAKKRPKYLDYAMVGLVGLILFFGAAFTIMAFNSDIGIHNVFSKFYTLMTGRVSSGFTVLEAGYSVGLAAGIIIFYNHFGKKRISREPTPIEVEMRLYGDDVNTTLVEGVKRRGEHIDVD